MQQIIDDLKLRHKDFQGWFNETSFGDEKERIWTALSEMAILIDRLCQRIHQLEEKIKDCEGENNKKIISFS
ncbi:hypothetical protein [Methylacidiphilum caldifontis]|uniref:Uncharacterized protein n=1 Tax=Methylacidiphilum caldifontis TaxID=2795386 RepID=A0A4Y8P9A8_9BACT|nr:hypothetical protein [Methylacidiphilum caldifontis]TFE66997.1 hypothetical protein A7Q10_01720 [Methylacidiphilum caldifontis]